MESKMPESAQIRTYPRTDLCACTPQAFKDCLDFAFDIGRRDEMSGWARQTGAKLADTLTIRRRQGHERALKATYEAARFHVRTMGEGTRRWRCSQCNQEWSTASLVPLHCPVCRSRGYEELTA